MSTQLPTGATTDNGVPAPKDRSGLWVALSFVVLIPAVIMLINWIF